MYPSESIRGKRLNEIILQALDETLQDPHGTQGGIDPLLFRIQHSVDGARGYALACSVSYLLCKLPAIRDRLRFYTQKIECRQDQLS